MYAAALLHRKCGDTLSTAAVIVGGFVILWTGQYWVRCGAIIRDRRTDFCGRALAICARNDGNILLEGTPRGISLEAVESTMRGARLRE